MANQISNEIPEKNMSFKLNPTNAIKLKQSITALCDSEFNPNGLGMVEVTEMGFEITVGNFQTKAVGKLFLNSSGLINFHCNTPILGKMIHLNKILENATHGGDDDTITIFHLNGSSNLSFIFGRAATEELKVEFLDIDVEFQKLPDMDICCETVLESEILRKLIALLVCEKGTKVSFDISAKQVTLYTGNDSWSFGIRRDDENFEARIFSDANNYHALFEIKHLEALKKASTMATRFHLGLNTEPSENIVIRFKLEEVGDLVFVYKPKVILKNTRIYDIGKNFENTSEVMRLFNDLGMK